MPKKQFEFPQKGLHSDRARYQNATAAWAVKRLKEQSGVLLCDPVGNGKTWEALLTAVRLADPKTGGKRMDRILIVANKTELSSKWYKELDSANAKKTDSVFTILEKNAGRPVPDVFRGDRTTIDDLKAADDHDRYYTFVARYSRDAYDLFERNPKGIWIVSSHMLGIMLNGYPNKTDPLDSEFDLIIFDECHHAKKRSVRRLKRHESNVPTVRGTVAMHHLLRISQLNPNAKRLGLTATPFGANQSQDFINLIDLFCSSADDIGGLLPGELTELEDKLNLWLTNEDSTKASQKELEDKFSECLVRTPNIRPRQYYFTGETPELIERIDALPVPNLFTLNKDGTLVNRELSEPISEEDLVALTAIRTAIGFENTDSRAAMMYSHL